MSSLPPRVLPPSNVGEFAGARAFADVLFRHDAPLVVNCEGVYNARRACRLGAAREPASRLRRGPRLGLVGAFSSEPECHRERSLGGDPSYATLITPFFVRRRRDVAVAEFFAARIYQTESCYAGACAQRRNGRPCVQRCACALNSEYAQPELRKRTQRCAGSFLSAHAQDCRAETGRSGVISRPSRDTVDVMSIASTVGGAAIHFCGIAPQRHCAAGWDDGRGSRRRARARLRPLNRAGDGPGRAAAKMDEISSTFHGAK